jgi:Mitochondrial carrier protein
MQTNPTQYSGVIGTVSNIWRNEGITAFWKGAIPTAAGMAAENAMAFGVNAALKRAFPEPKLSHLQQEQMPSLGRPFLMGAMTGCCSALVLLPSEIVKAKLQVVVGANVTAQHIMQQMVHKQGYMSYMTGLDAQLARDASFYAVFFGSYELSCYMFRTYIPSMPDELNYFISGGFAGMFGWTCAMPFDVPKTVRFIQRNDVFFHQYYTYFHSSCCLSPSLISLYCFGLLCVKRMYKLVMKQR